MTKYGYHKISRNENYFLTINLCNLKFLDKDLFEEILQENDYVRPFMCKAGDLPEIEIFDRKIFYKIYFSKKSTF